MIINRIHNIFIIIIIIFLIQRPEEKDAEVVELLLVKVAQCEPHDISVSPTKEHVIELPFRCHELNSVSVSVSFFLWPIQRGVI